MLAPASLRHGLCIGQALSIELTDADLDRTELDRTQLDRTELDRTELVMACRLRMRGEGEAEGAKRVGPAGLGEIRARYRGLRTVESRPYWW